MRKKYRSDNATNADNQQERLGIEKWMVGFTDGEGCFCVSIIKNKTTKSGWQIFPEFVITQGIKSLPVLKIFRNYFNCGNIFANKRYDNHKEDLCRFCVRSVKDLYEKIIPFFKKNHLLTAKYKDFQIFTEIVKMMVDKKHLTKSGIRIIAKKIEKMNHRKLSRFLESSETIRLTSK